MVSGIATDKIARYERWGQQEREDLSARTGAFVDAMERLLAVGGVSMSVQVARPKIADDTEIVG